MIDISTFKGHQVNLIKADKPELENRLRECRQVLADTDARWKTASTEEEQLLLYARSQAFEAEVNIISAVLNHRERQAAA